MGQSEWRDAFRNKNGREPSIEEFKQAKLNGFELAESNFSDTNSLKAWIRDFENRNQRQPTIEEVKERRELMENSLHQSFTERPIQQEKKQLDDETVGNAVHRRGMRKPSKKHWLLLTLVAAAVVLIAIISYGFNYYSYSNSLNRAAITLKTYDQSKYRQVAVWSDSNKKMTSTDLTPLANYMQEQKMSQSNTEDWMKKSGNGVHFVRDGQSWLIFPHYVLKMDPFDLTVNTNQSNLSISVNGEVLTDKSESDYSDVLKHQAPGLYTFKEQGNLNGQNVDTQSNDYYGGSDSESVDLNIQTISFTVESNLDGGDVYVSGNKVGTISDGHADVKNIAVTKGAKVYVKSGSGSDAITTSSESLSSIDDGDTVTLDSDDVLSKSDAEDQLDSMASMLTSYASSEDTPSNVSGVFNDGTNNQTYKNWIDMIHRNRHSSQRNADSINFGDITVDQVSAQSKKKADVTFEIKEDFNYTEDTDPDNHTSGTKTQRYQLIAHMIYDKSKDEWLIDSIDSNQKKLSDDDNVN